MADLSLPPVPAALKMVQPYLRRATELMTGKLGAGAWPQARLNAIAHLCLSYSLQQANIAAQQQGSTAPDTLAFIQRLHFVQQSTSPYRHAEDDADLGAFALELFDWADDDDMAGRADQTTARNFYTARLLMDVASGLFGELPVVLQTRRKYAQWRANTITRALSLSPTVPAHKGWAAFYEHLEMKAVEARIKEVKQSSLHLFEKFVEEHIDDAGAADGVAGVAGAAGAAGAHGDMRAGDGAERSAATGAAPLTVASDGVNRALLTSENLSPSRKRIEEVYDIAEEELGRGAFGVVRKIRKRSNGRQYAMKVLKLSLSVDGAALEKLRHEIHVMKRLDHPNIVKLYETYTSVSKGEIYLVMELCTGGELFDRLMAQPAHRYTESVVAEIARQVLGPIQYCHAHGIVHRDVKLQNFLLEHTEDGAPVKLIDFGLAKYFASEDPSAQMHADSMVAAEAHTEATGSTGGAGGPAQDFGRQGSTGAESGGAQAPGVANTPPQVPHASGAQFSKMVAHQIVGSLYYIAPEVLMGEYDEKCDVWSIGVMVFQMLTGHTPFWGESDEGVRRSICSAPLSFGDLPLSPAAKDFVSRLLTRNLDPSKGDCRPSADEALSHPWLKAPAGELPSRPLSRSIWTAFEQFKTFSALRKTALELIAHQLDPREIVELRELFRILDTANTGTITFAEFAAAMKTHPSVSNEEMQAHLRQLFDSINISGSGAIRYSEFVAALVWRRCDLTAARLRGAFEALDVEKKGTLTIAQIRQAVGRDGLVSEGTADWDEMTAVLKSYKRRKRLEREIARRARKCAEIGSIEHRGILYFRPAMPRVRTSRSDTGDSRSDSGSGGSGGSSDGGVANETHRGRSGSTASRLRKSLVSGFSSLKDVFRSRSSTRSHRSGRGSVTDGKERGARWNRAHFVLRDHIFRIQDATETEILYEPRARGCTSIRDCTVSINNPQVLYGVAPQLVDAYGDNAMQAPVARVQYDRSGSSGRSPASPPLAEKQTTLHTFSITNFDRLWASNLPLCDRVFHKSAQEVQFAAETAEDAEHWVQALTTGVTLGAKTALVVDGSGSEPSAAPQRLSDTGASGDDATLGSSGERAQSSACSESEDDDILINYDEFVMLMSRTTFDAHVSHSSFNCQDLSMSRRDLSSKSCTGRSHLGRSLLTGSASAAGRYEMLALSMSGKGGSDRDRTRSRLSSLSLSNFMQSVGRSRMSSLRGSSLYESDQTQDAVARLSSALTDMSISGGLQRFGSSGRGGVVGDARRAASFSTDTLRDLVPRQKRARNSVPSPSLEDQSGKQVEEVAGMLSSQSLDGIALDQNLDEQPKLSTVVEARDSQRSSRASDSGETWDVNVFGRRPSVATALRASGAVN